MSRKIILLMFALAMIVSPFGYASAGQSVGIEVGADCPVVQTGGGGKITARVLVRPFVRENRGRAPLAVALVVDKSGSMGTDDKMENAKLGAMEALEMLDARDRAAVIVYDSNAHVLVKATGAGETENFRRKIGRVTAGGNTALYDGVVAGVSEISRFARDGAALRVILLSDGLANIGPSSAGEISALGRRLSGEDVAVTTIGLGLDYDEDLMTALASESGGNAYFAKNSRVLADIFRRDMKDALSLTGRRVRVTFECGGGVRPIRAIGREGRVDGDIIEVDIDNLYGAEKYALFDLEIPDGEDGETLKTGTARIEYIDAYDGSSVTLSSPLEIRYSSDTGAVTQNRDADITAQAEMARNAEIREEAVKLADSGQADAAAQILRDRSTYLKSVMQSFDAAYSAAPIQGEISEFEEMSDYMKENDSMSNEQRKENINKAYAAKNQQSADDPGDTDEDED
jgi:Ca-activated chloride channel family protein